MWDQIFHYAHLLFIKGKIQILSELEKPSNGMFTKIYYVMQFPASFLPYIPQYGFEIKQPCGWFLVAPLINHIILDNFLRAPEPQSPPL